MHIIKPEEKYIHEIRRLRRELDQANEKIYTLTSQLTANVSVVTFCYQFYFSVVCYLDSKIEFFLTIFSYDDVIFFFGQLF